VTRKKPPKNLLHILTITKKMHTKEGILRKSCLLNFISLREMNLNILTVLASVFTLMSKNIVILYVRICISPHLYFLHQCFSTFFCFRHPFCLKKFGGTLTYLKKGTQTVNDLTRNSNKLQWDPTPLMPLGILVCCGTRLGTTDLQ